jgi:predicted branched-subunit amino acid permease
MPKATKGGRSGMDWTIISQNVALGVVIVVLSWMAVGLGLHQLPLVGVAFQFFMPLAFVILMSYFRSEQKTRAQAVAEGVFAGCILLVVLNLMLAVISIIQPATG